MGSHHKIRLPEGLHVIACPAMLDIPRELVGYLSRLLAAQRRARGTRRNTRALTCWKQALFVLAWFRKQEDLTVLGAGFGISRATAYRYHDEAVTVLAEQAPTGFPLWVGDVEPGSTHDLVAAREQVLGTLYRAASQPDLPALADGGYDGTGIGRSNNQPAVRYSTRTTAPTTPSYAGCAAWANAGSPCSPPAGAPYGTSPPAPRKSATSSKPHSYSPISNTTRSRESR
jgi:DDE superfamily endonuclease